MGDAGTPYGRFRRALERGNVLNALSAATELQHVPLEDALELSLLLLDKEPQRYPRAAARFIRRYVDEVPAVELEEVSTTASYLGALREGDDSAATALAELWEARRLPKLAAVVRRRVEENRLRPGPVT